MQNDRHNAAIADRTAQSEAARLDAILQKLADYATELTSQYEARAEDTAQAGSDKQRALRNLAFIKTMAEIAQHVDVTPDLKLQGCDTMRKLFERLGNSIDVSRLDQAQMTLGATQ